MCKGADGWRGGFWAALYVGDADYRLAFVGQIAASTRHSVRQAREPPGTGECVKREDAWTGVGIVMAKLLIAG